MMKRIEINVLYFGPAADAAGCSGEEVALEPGGTLRSLMEELVRRHPALDGHREALRFAVNQEYSGAGGEEARLADGDEVALIPPVAGGEDGPHVELTGRAIDAGSLLRRVGTAGAGAVNLFLGTVRAEGEPDNPLEALEYSAYPEMALREMRKICRAASGRFDVSRIALVHRTGRMVLGETSVAVAVSAPHRDHGFRACRFIIDRLKEAVPIWKKEIWRRGESTWVGPAKKPD